MKGKHDKRERLGRGEFQFRAGFNVNRMEPGLNQDGPTMERLHKEARFLAAVFDVEPAAMETLQSIALKCRKVYLRVLCRRSQRKHSQSGARDLTSTRPGAESSPNNKFLPCGCSHNPAVKSIQQKRSDSAQLRSSLRHSLFRSTGWRSNSASGLSRG